MNTANLASRTVESPEILKTLSCEDTRLVLARLLEATGAAFAKWVGDGQDDQIAKQRAAGDRLLDIKQVAKRLGCSAQTVMRGWRAGRYPFMLKDGGRMVGSEDGLERWIKARVKRSA